MNVSKDVSNDGLDLPLVANSHEILVKSYEFHLNCDLKRRVFRGWVTLRFEPMQVVADENRAKTGTRTGAKEFNVLLDAKDISVVGVIEGRPREEYPCPCRGEERAGEANSGLNFSVEKWLVRIWKEGVFWAQDFPREVTIFYKAQPQGESLSWVEDDEGRSLTVYSHGTWINNRALFPCQEPPEAMACWEATVCVPQPFILLMSGDEGPQTETCSETRSRFRYKTEAVLPISTLALAVGSWEERRIQLPVHPFVCSLYCHRTLIDKAYNVLSEWLPKYVAAAHLLLGTYPFPQLIVLIVPRSFDGLGMANPNLMYLSQSVFSGSIESLLTIRVAHEFAHSWFGLSIGASDWTEEWISEGFATFLEERIHNLVDESPSSRERQQLRDHLKWKRLESEMKNVEEDLLVLRLNGGKKRKVQLESGEIVGNVVNGMNHIKGCIQVHYLKGYFLLRYLSSIVGESNFMEMLKDFFVKYEGNLITSNDCLVFYCQRFPEKCKENNLTPDTVCEAWLDSSTLPFNNPIALHENSLYAKVETEFKKWKLFDGKKRRNNINFESSLESEQIQILLEKLTEKRHLKIATIERLDAVYCLSQRNVEVRHGFCELIVKHSYQVLPDQVGHRLVKRFLEEEQAMGVYLYGEMLFSANEALKRLALDCFKSLDKEMNSNFKKIVQTMVDSIQFERWSVERWSGLTCDSPADAG